MMPPETQPMPAQKRSKDIASDAIAPLAVAARQLGAMLGLSVRTIRSMDAGGKLPRPIRLNGSVRWIVTEIQAWLHAGAPGRADWEALKAHT